MAQTQRFACAGTGRHGRDSTSKLAAIGVEEKEVNIRNKLARGKFTAAFLLQCLTAIGATEVRL